MTTEDEIERHDLMATRLSIVRMAVQILCLAVYESSEAGRAHVEEMIELMKNRHDLDPILEKEVRLFLDEFQVLRNHPG